MLVHVELDEHDQHQHLAVIGCRESPGHTLLSSILVLGLIASSFFFIIEFHSANLFYSEGLLDTGAGLKYTYYSSSSSSSNPLAGVVVHTCGIVVLHKVITESPELH